MMRPKEADTDLFVGGRSERGVMHSPTMRAGANDEALSYSTHGHTKTKKGQKNKA